MKRIGWRTAFWGNSNTCDQEKGSALLEFTVIAPMILILIIGAMDVGRMLNQYLAVTQVVREGVRLAAGLAELENGEFATANQSSEPMQHLVQSRVQQLLDIEDTSSHLSNISITTEYCQDGTGCSGTNMEDKVRVVVQADYDGFFPLFDHIPLTIRQAGPYLFQR